MSKKWFVAGFYIIVSGCSSIEQQNNASPVAYDSIVTISSTKNETVIDTLPMLRVVDSADLSTKYTLIDSMVNFAQTLIGIPYKYGSTDPSQGFDCSGFITYVYNHFNIKVPRSSIGFTNVSKAIPLPGAVKGDLILFRGTDSTERFVGHMGIIISSDNGHIQFIHSTSGKAYGVTITPLNDYYKKRFIKIVRGTFVSRQAGK